LTLRSLNLNGAKVKPRHVPIILPLTKHLEELGLGYTELTMADVVRLFSKPSTNTDENRNKTDWQPPTLHYIDLTGVASCTQPSLYAHAQQLLGPASKPLEVIEVGSKVVSGLEKAKATNRDLGWAVKGLGRRSWYVREPRAKQGEIIDNGERDWKMGGRWWGMKKVPVAWSDVGGLYGAYMFKM
jgi:hypothetical protein